MEVLKASLNPLSLSPEFVDPQRCLASCHKTAMAGAQTALAATWGFSAGAVSIIIISLILRKYRKQRFMKADYANMAAIICLLSRAALLNITLVWGTNAVSMKYRATHTFTARETYRREVGSITRLANRVLYIG
jgi:hypothetical protein